MDSDSLDLESPAPRARPRLAAFTFVLALASAMALALLVTTSDPGQREQEVFVGLLLGLSTGLGSTVFLAAGAGGFRGLRRGLLFGLGCAGAAVLQINAALSAPNLGFLLLVLAIVETIFLARRQHPA